MPDMSDKDPNVKLQSTRVQPTGIHLFVSVQENEALSKEARQVRQQLETAKSLLVQR